MTDLQLHDRGDAMVAVGGAAGRANGVARPFAEKFTTERRLRREHEDVDAFDLQFEAARARAQKIPSDARLAFDGDQGAEDDGEVGAGRWERERGVKFDVSRDLGGEAGLALGEISGLLAVHVVLVLGTAFLADGFVAGELRGAKLEGVLLLECGEDMVANGGLVGRGERNHGRGGSGEFDGAMGGVVNG